MPTKLRYLGLSLVSLLLLILLLSLLGGPSIGYAQEPSNPPDKPLETAFTYQGFLSRQGHYFDGTCDFRFALFNVREGGTPIAPPLSIPNVRVKNGYFTVKLDFGVGAINGTKRWLAIAVACPSPASESSFRHLLPRQQLTPVPHALALPGLWTQPGLSPNLIGGFYGNHVSPDARGATIDGGGSANLANSTLVWPFPPLEPADQPRTSRAVNAVTAPYGTVGGGLGNTGDRVAVVGGGVYNDALGPGTTIGGGGLNTARGLAASIMGGYKNIALGNYSTVGGGRHNTVIYTNTTVSGGAFNTVDKYGATIGGGISNQATGEVATIAGGSRNTLFGLASTIGGGADNKINRNIGDLSERRTAFATIAGGGRNLASGYGTTISGGECNSAGLDNPAADLCPNPDDPTQDPDARGVFATVSGGAQNRVVGHFGTVGGGGGNIAGGLGATIGGGRLNMAGDGNPAIPEAAGDYATVPGGLGNAAQGNYSFAAGHRAQANHQGSFVWADAANADLASTGDNQFIVRASGGIWLGHNSSPSIRPDAFLDTSTGAWLSQSGTWNNNSDRRAKEYITPVDGREILTRLAQLPISTWNYKVDDPAIRHLGPMAQDFRAAFGLGSNETSIATLDADGVALAAIQGLYQVTQEQQAQIVLLEQQNQELEARVAALERLVSSLSELQEEGER